MSLAEIKEILEDHDLGFVTAEAIQTALQAAEGYAEINSGTHVCVEFACVLKKLFNLRLKRTLFLQAINNYDRYYLLACVRR